MADKLKVTDSLEESINKFTLLKHLGMLADACVDTFASKSDLDELKGNVDSNISEQLNLLDETLADLKSDVEANMPSKVSDLENDAGYITSVPVQSIDINGTTQTPVNGVVDITIPTKVSQLTNDSGFTTNTGTVTKATVNGSTINPSSGTLALGNLVSSIDINGTTVSPSSGKATITTALTTLIDAKIQAAIGDALAASY